MPFLSTPGISFSSLSLSTGSLSGGFKVIFFFERLHVDLDDDDQLMIITTWLWCCRLFLRLILFLHLQSTFLLLFLVENDLLILSQGINFLLSPKEVFYGPRQQVLGKSWDARYTQRNEEAVFSFFFFSPECNDDHGRKSCISLFSSPFSSTVSVSPSLHFECYPLVQEKVFLLSPWFIFCSVFEFIWFSKLCLPRTDRHAYLLNKLMRRIEYLLPFLILFERREYFGGYSIKQWLY